jgi:hypothetical protein
LVKKIIRRPKYATADNTKIVIGNLPSRPIEKGIAEAEFIGTYSYPKIHRSPSILSTAPNFQTKLKLGFTLRTLNDWLIACCTLLKPLVQFIGQKIIRKRLFASRRISDQGNG